MSINEQVENFIKATNEAVTLDRDEFLDCFFDKQKEYILNPSRKRVTLYYGGRRGGKSSGNVGLIIYTDLFDKPTLQGRIVYASATQEKAKDLAWLKLQRWAKEFGFSWTFKDKESKILTPRNEIVFRGLKDITNANKDQGFRLKLCVIDEPQTVNSNVLEHYMNNVIIWGLTELQGRLCLTGNPPHFPHAFIKEQYYNKENNLIVTNIFDNKALDAKKTKDFIDAERKRRGLEVGNEDSYFKRSVYGEYVEDFDSIVFPIDKVKNFYSALPDGHYKTVMGVDIGWHDADAIAILKVNRDTGEIFVELEYEKAKQDVSSLCRKIVELMGEWDIKYPPVMDTGGIGKKLAEELTARYGLYFEAAKKTDKMAFVEILRSDIINGLIKFKIGSKFAKEAKQIIYTATKEKIDTKMGLKSDLQDAILYAYRFIYQSIKAQHTEVKKTFVEKRIDSILKSRKKSKRNYPY